MTRHCCPKCKDHPILNGCLECDSCKGSYIWIPHIKKLEDDLHKAVRSISRSGT